MLKLYYTPISLNSRRLWVADRLEKQMASEPIELNLDRMFGIFCDECRKLQVWCDRAGSSDWILLLALVLVTEVSVVRSI